MIEWLASMLAAPALPGLVLKATAILAGGGLIAALARRRPASTRHFIWLVALASALALAALAPIVPRLVIRVPAPKGFQASHGSLIGRPSDLVSYRGNAPAEPKDTPPRRAEAALAASSRVSPVRPAPSPGPGLPLGLVWLAGTLAVLLWSLLGHWGLRRLGRGAVPIECRAWWEMVGEAPERRVLDRGVRVASSAWVGGPLTWGWPRAIILLPRDADSWPAERRRVALLHELAHVARRDYLAQLVATLTCAVYWFHPLAWLATARLRAEGELACDDHVLAQGTPPDEYATTLLEIARRARQQRRLEFAGVAMAHPSRLEGRLLAVLDHARRRGTMSRRAAAIALVAVGLLLVPFAGLAPQWVRADAWARSDKKPRPASTSESDPASRIERTITTGAGARLRLELETGGDVEIQGWDQASVQVRAQLGGDDWRGTRVEVERESGGVVIRAHQERDRESYSTSHGFEIRVPRRYDVQLNSAGGGIKIVDVEGTFRGHTGGGEIVLEHDKGHARLTTGGGDIQAADSELDGSVSTGGGTVQISRVKGDLRGMSGSGPVIQADGGENDGSDVSGDLSGLNVDGEGGHIGVGQGTPVGFLRINKAGGDVDLDGAPDGARITTGGGDIHVGPGAGRVEAHTGGGDIEIGPIAGSVKAGTGAGTVHVTLTDDNGRTHEVEIWSGTGKVILDLPDDLRARFDLETAYTRSFGRATHIESAWTLDRETTTNWDPTQGTPRRYVRAHGVVGKGGGLITVRTVNGDIEVRRTHGR